MLLAMDIEALVEDQGHEVVGLAASSGEVEALETDMQPQLALVDIHLARGSSGLDVCQRIIERWSECVVIFLTANVAKIPADFCGGHGVVAKPFSQGGMVNVLDYLAGVILGPVPLRIVPPSLTPSERLNDRLAQG